MVVWPDSTQDNGSTTYTGESVSDNVIQFPARPQRRLVRRKNAPVGEVIDFGPHLAERERQISVAVMAAAIRSTLAEADRLAGNPRVDRAYRETAW
jgi:hypothetical protein